MADDGEQLLIELVAKVDAFERALDRANRNAQQNFSSIEKRAKQAADSMQANLTKAAQGVAGIFSGIGNNFLGAAGISGLGLSALVATAIKLNGELARISGLAREAGLSTDRLQEIKFAAKGLGDEEFTAGMRTSLGLIDEAQRQVNSLSRLFNANGLSIRDANGDLIKFDTLLENAARLMAGTRDEQSKVKIAEMVGLSREWVTALRDGPEAFRQSAAEAHNAGAVIDAETVQRAKDFDKAWKAAITRFKAGMTEALADLADGFREFWAEVTDSVPGARFLSDALDKWAGGLKGMSLPELEDALKRSIEQGVGQVEIDRIQAEIDRRLGKTPLRVKVTPEVDTSTPTVIPKEHERNSFDRAVFETNKRIAAMDAETASIGLNTEARTRAKLVAELEEAAKEANTRAGFQNATITDVQREKINQLADAMEGAAKRSRESHEQLLKFAVEGRDFTKQFDQLAVSAFGSFENAFAGFVTGTKTAQQAFADMANAISADLAKMVARMMITAPLAQAIGGAFGVGGGAPLNILPGGFADGGYTGAGGKYQPAGIVHAGEYVFDQASVNRIGVPTLDRLRGYVSGGAVIPASNLGSPRGGSTGGVRITSNVYNNANVSAEQQVTPDGQGGFTIDTVISTVEDHMADRIARNRSSLGKTIRSVTGHGAGSLRG